MRPDDMCLLSDGGAAILLGWIGSTTVFGAVVKEP